MGQVEMCDNVSLNTGTVTSHTGLL